MGNSHCNFNTFFFSSSAVSLFPFLSDTRERKDVILKVPFLSFEFLKFVCWSFLWFDMEEVEKGIIQTDQLIFPLQ